MKTLTSCVFPEWPALGNVHAFTTTSALGNMQLPSTQIEMCQRLKLPELPQWLTQVHGNEVINLNNEVENLTADACFSKSKQQICAIFTADCLPILLCNQAGDRVAAVHAGWRGLLSGVIDNTVSALDCDPRSLLAWLGPAIGPDHFEVNSDIRHNYLQRHDDYALGFNKSEGNWHGDLYRLATINLRHCGVISVFGGGFCTFCDNDRFYSYRRDQGVTGRMVSLIWFE